MPHRHALQVLKEEIRRQERNQQRAEAANLEYLKNVTLKFIESTSEQQSLIPVMGMLLHFSPEELRRVQVRSAVACLPASHASAGQARRAAAAKQHSAGARQSVRLLPEVGVAAVDSCASALFMPGQHHDVVSKAISRWISSALVPCASRPLCDAMRLRTDFLRPRSTLMRCS